MLNYYLILNSVSHGMIIKKGLTKTTTQSYVLLKEALFDALSCDQTYNVDYEVIDRCIEK